jgi:hypothetical protein
MQSTFVRLEGMFLPTRMKLLKLSTILLSALVLTVMGGTPFAAKAQTAQRSFSDVPPTHYAFEAVEFLKANGIISGYADGTFKPDTSVNRAEATKIIVAPKVTPDALSQFSQTVFSDIPADAWYLPYVEAGRQALGFIDGPPAKTAFNGQNGVVKVEFLKMLLLANKIDVSVNNDITLPLADDVTNGTEWYYPYMRYALSSSMTMIGNDGTLGPGRGLTRGQVALLMHRFLMYQQQRRTQALLSETENEILLILNALAENNIAQAEYAATRGLLAARGADASRPDTPIVQGALKIAEAFHALVRGYRAGLNKDFATVQSLSSEAWNKAAEAKTINPDMQSVVEQVQKSAHDMAESARGLQ